MRQGKESFLSALFSGLEIAFQEGCRRVQGELSEISRRAELGRAGLCVSVTSAFVELLFQCRSGCRKEGNKQSSGSVGGRKRSHSNKKQQGRFRIDPRVIPLCVLLGDCIKRM